MLSTHILVYKLENKYFQKCMALNTIKNILKEGTFQKGYVENISLEIIEKIKNHIDGKKFGSRLIKPLMQKITLLST
jgi:hypothetical protein